MSVNLLPQNVSEKVTQRPISEIAQSFEIDPRIPATVPGFDAPFFQAGLAGYSDGAMRLVARQHGCPYCITEALLDRTLINGGKGRTREDPDLLAEECGTGEIEENRPVSNFAAIESFTGDSAALLNDHPIAGQIMGTFPDEMAEGAALLAHMGYEAIDVNLACPVKKIRKRARGGHFLTQPDDAIAILRAVRAAVPANIPTTVKLRRGWDDQTESAQRFEEIFSAAYDIGYAWATVHCRTVEQKYKGPGRWAFLTDLVARHPDKVIFGSGDIWQVDDIFAMLELTGVKAVSVARGCIGNPWIFKHARELMRGETPSPPTIAQQRETLLLHFELSVRLWGEKHASRMMRKFGIKFSHHHPQGESVKAAFIQCESVVEWRKVIKKWYAKCTTYASPPNAQRVRGFRLRD